MLFCLHEHTAQIERSGCSADSLSRIELKRKKYTQRRHNGAKGVYKNWLGFEVALF